MGNSQSKQEKAPLEQFDVILQLLAKRGVLPDTKVTDDARRAAMQKRLRDSYHNTELLLKNYRTIAWMLECFPEALAEELDRPFETVDQLLDGIDIASTFGERKLEHRTAAVEQTRLLMERIEKAGACVLTCSRYAHAPQEVCACTNRIRTKTRSSGRSSPPGSLHYCSEPGLTISGARKER